MAAKFPAVTGTSDGGSAASSSKKTSDACNLCNEIVQKLKQSGNSEEVDSEEFYSGLLKHFDRFSDGYYTENRFQDILIHKRCLESAKDAPQQPIIYVNQIQADDNISETTTNLVTQITIAVYNKPELFNEVLKASVAIGLDFKEIYSYRTTDRCLLGVFILAECKYETEHLKKTLENELSKSETSEGTMLLQIQSHDVDPHQFQNLTEAFLYWMGLSINIIAACLLGVGIEVMCGAAKAADILGGAENFIWKKLIGNVPEESDKGAVLVFVAAPFVGIVMFLFLLLQVIKKSMVMKAKVPIIAWLIVCLILGVSLPFMEVKEAAIKNEAAAMFSTLITVLALLTNFHRRHDGR